MHAQSFPVLWIDLETTGTDSNRHGVVQIAGMIEVEGAIVNSFDFHVKPFSEDEIEDAALAVNGITREQFQHFADSKQVHRELVALFGRYVDKFNKTEKMLFAGYNATFDLDFMHAFFRKNGDPYLGSWIWWPPRDVAILAGHQLEPVRHTLQNFKQETVAAHLGIAPDGRVHDAMTDIRMTRDIYRKLFHHLGESSSCE